MAALNIGRGRENSWSHDQSKSATERLLTKMVKQGKLPQSALVAMYGPATDTLPTTLINSRPRAEVVYQHTKGRIPGVCYLQRAVLLASRAPSKGMLWVVDHKTTY